MRRQPGQGDFTYPYCPAACPFLGLALAGPFPFLPCEKGPLTGAVLGLLRKAGGHCFAAVGHRVGKRVYQVQRHCGLVVQQPLSTPTAQYRFAALRPCRVACRVASLAPQSEHFAPRCPGWPKRKKPGKRSPGREEAFSGRSGTVAMSRLLDSNQRPAHYE